MWPLFVTCEGKIYGQWKLRFEDWGWTCQDMKVKDLFLHMLNIGGSTQQLS